MKTFNAILSLFLITALVYYSFYGLMPRYDESKTPAPTEFSVDKALTPLEEIAKQPHYLGSKGHEDVRKFLISELYKLGMEPHIQEGFSLNPESKTLNKPINIAARIKGSQDGKSLLLLSHYDSALVPSYGAADAGTGLVAILESVRAYLASGKRPQNDIIILFTDAEEIGLDGAKLFVNEHPWAENVGLVLNFEARGTSGPSNMILETNGGNSKLVKEFLAANPDFPVASSLMYSVYKMLPNDTDSTIFRKDGDIDSFFFAFIDSHFNYHTANDNMYFLDWNSLMHQGSYLLPLIHYFADADLSNLKSDTDHVYLNFPLVKMISYPFSWILPMLIIATLVFWALIFYGIRKGKLIGKAIARGFVPFLLALISCGLIGFFGWKLLLALYPQYTEIQQGFTYNGHWYIVFFVFLSLAITFTFYKKFAIKFNEASFYVAPLFFWLLVNLAVFIILKGAAFFIIPVFFGLLSFFVMLRQERPNLLAMTFLAVPAIFIFAPLIQFFPVGLGLKMLVISCVFTVLLFGLLWPVFGYYRRKNLLATVCFLLAISFFVVAHSKSGFSEERRKPNSLVYFEDADAGKTYWLTYDTEIDTWTANYFGTSAKSASGILDEVSYSKYGTDFSFAAEAPAIEIPNFEVILEEDTLIANLRNVELSIVPKRRVNKIELYPIENIDFKYLEFNGQKASVSDTLKNYRGTKNRALINYFVSPNDSLKVKFSIEKNTPVSFKVMEYSFDLMDNPKFNITERPDFTMPKPFVITDAVLVKRTFSVDSLKMKRIDSL
ncbi:M20/M25/M40 family metallo-hydrolase [Aequorivita marina]|uniref:M20/M25/M40 family metallo-hydrolase n=1 Tax=Aequorivita marina TaxID=3073654 RepID=UPI002874D50F|nr:M20/M25/M40 family metallo-hydrolase [Aequorivita sp. S2608]MDS1297515.1 M20/M25/M40 family metallo-hydrolase [Aequorivita sp. S2608]